MNGKPNRLIRKIRRGVVIKDKMDKTITVAVERKFRHPLYKKVIRRTSPCKVHDEKNSAAVGDLVEIMETRPLSRTKRWRLVKILRAVPRVASSGSGESV